MCIAVLSTAHPDYPFILLSNRDELLSRPTAPLSSHPDPKEPSTTIYHGTDLLSPSLGTWLGITSTGRIAVLTNFREDSGVEDAAKVSRGVLVKEWLASEETVAEFVGRLRGGDGEEGVLGKMGGFTLLFGNIRDLIPDNSSVPTPSGDEDDTRGLAVLSNRTAAAPSTITTSASPQNSDVLPPIDSQSPSTSPSIPRILISPGQTIALSNTHSTDQTWPKCTTAVPALEELIKTHSQHDSSPESHTTSQVQPQSQSTSPLSALPESATNLVDSCFDLLSTDTLPPHTPSSPWSTYSYNLRKSIFVPATPTKPSPTSTSLPTEPINARDENLYGTQKQSVIFVDREGNVTFVERTLWDEEGRKVEVGSGDVVVRFRVEVWGSEQ